MAKFSGDRVKSVERIQQIKIGDDVSFDFMVVDVLTDERGDKRFKLRINFGYHRSEALVFEWNSTGLFFFAEDNK